MSLQFVARDQDCVLVERMGIGEKKFLVLMDMEQQVTGDQMESGHRKLDYGTPTDDEEVTLPPHNRDTQVPDIPDTYIRDRQAMSDTQ